MDKMNIGDAVRIRLEILLDQYSISKAELARRANLPSRTVENYFKGYTPSVEALFSLAKGMRVSVDWLLGDVFSAELSEAKQRATEFQPERECIVAAASEILSAYPPESGQFSYGKTTAELSNMIGVNAYQKLLYVRTALEAGASARTAGEES